MAKQFEDGPILSTPSPRSNLERRLTRAELEARIAASKEKQPALPASPLDGIAERPTIGALPPPPPLVDEANMAELDEPVPEEWEGEPEVTENVPVRVAIPRDIPIRK